jgi:hypothetical protein
MSGGGRSVLVGRILYLRDGAICTHPVDTFVGVTYTTERDGRRLVGSVDPMSE